MSREPDIVHMDNMERAIELRLAGLTLNEIARELGFKSRNSSSVASLLRKAFAQRISPLVEEYRQVMGERLETLVSSLWPAALAGDILSIDRILKIMDRQAKLFGLDQMPLPRRAEDLGGVEWVRPIAMDRQKQLKGRIDLIEDSKSSMIVQPDSESLPVAQDGEKTLLQ